MAIIKQLKNFFTQQIIYPKTLTKAVYDADNGERLDKILRDTMLATDNEEYSGVVPRDADTLGGKYTKSDIESLIEDNKELKSNLSLDYSNADPSIQDINTFLQKALEKLFPAFDGIIFENGIKKIPLLSSTSGTGTVSDTANLIVNSGLNGGAAFYTKEKIDLSKFSKLYIQCTNNTGSYGVSSWIGVSNSVPITYDTSELLSYTSIVNGNTTAVHDISNYNDSYYLIFEAMCNNDEQKIARTNTFTRIWLE